MICISALSRFNRLSAGNTEYLWRSHLLVVEPMIPTMWKTKTDSKNLAHFGYQKGCTFNQIMKTTQNASKKRAIEK